MKVRNKNRPEDIGCASRFDVNTCAPQEIFVAYEDEPVQEFARDLEVFIEAKQQWMPFGEAERNHDIIRDNYNTCFFEPKTPEDRERGYTL
jgi:hypothetical protein